MTATPVAHQTIRLGERSVPLIRFTGPMADVATVAAALADAGLPVGRAPVVVLVGGAAGLHTGLSSGSAWVPLFRDGLVAGLLRTGACLVDGGTDAGVMALAGTARGSARASYPAVGVFAEGTVNWPGHASALTDAAELGPEHTHLIAVPGHAWGQEVPWISRVAEALAGRCASVTVVVNGGPITLDDVRCSLHAGRRTLVVRGSGRLADVLATAQARWPQSAPESAPESATESAAEFASEFAPEAEIAASPLIDVIDGVRTPALLADAIAGALLGPGRQ